LYRSACLVYSGVAQWQSCYGLGLAEPNGYWAGQVATPACAHSLRHCAVGGEAPAAKQRCGLRHELLGLTTWLPGKVVRTRLTRIWVAVKRGWLTDSGEAMVAGDEV
jgi:hypothetical protein